MSLQKKINLTLITISSIFCLVFAAQASTYDTIAGGLNRTREGAGYAQTQFVPAWAVYVNAMVGLMGALFLIQMIYGGYLWMTARGKEEQITKAKTIIIQSAIGLGIIILARIIVEFFIYQLGQASSPTTG